MKIDIVIAIVCTAISAMTLAYLFVRGMLDTAGGMTKSGTSLRSILAPIALFVEHRRGRDPELSRTLERLEQYVVQSGGKFMDGATAAEVFSARFVLPLMALAVIVPVGVMLRIPGAWVFLGAAFFAVLTYAYPESGLKAGLRG